MGIKPGKKFDGWKSVKKFLKGLGYSVLLGVILVIAEHLEAAEGLGPEEKVWFGMIVSMLYALHNALKHWKDE